MHDTHHTEQFSLAYVRAITAVAGYGCDRHEMDNRSADLTISADGVSGAIMQPVIELQLKSSRSISAKNGQLTVTVPVHNYAHLRSINRAAPLFLVFVHMPPQPIDWFRQASPQLANLQHCAYWVDLRGLPETSNLTTIAVHVPQAQIFDPSALQGLMTRAGAGEFLPKIGPFP